MRYRMEEKMKNSREFPRIPMIVITTIMAVSIGMTYLVLDYSTLLEGIPVAGLMKIPISGFTLLKMFFTGTEQSYFNSLDKLFICCFVIVVIPYLISIALFILSIISNRSCYIASIVLSAIGLAIVIVGVLFVFPYVLERNVLSINNFSLNLSKPIREGLFHCLGISWWILTIGFAVVLVLSVFGFRNSSENEKTDDAYAPEHGIICRFGEYSGVSIPIKPGEALIIGRSSQKCNLLINDPFVSRLHCEVALNLNNNDFSITDFSSSGTYLNGNRISKSTAFPGDSFAIGKPENQIALY